MWLSSRWNASKKTGLAIVVLGASLVGLLLLGALFIFWIPAQKAEAESKESFQYDPHPYSHIQILLDRYEEDAFKIYLEKAIKEFIDTGFETIVDGVYVYVDTVVQEILRITNSDTKDIDHVYASIFDKKHLLHDLLEKQASSKTKLELKKMERINALLAVDGLKISKAAATNTGSFSNEIWEIENEIANNSVEHARYILNFTEELARNPSLHYVIFREILRARDNEGRHILFFLGGCKSLQSCKELYYFPQDSLVRINFVLEAMAHNSAYREILSEIKRQALTALTKRFNLADISKLMEVINVCWSDRIDIVKLIKLGLVISEKDFNEYFSPYMKSFVLEQEKKYNYEIQWDKIDRKKWSYYAENIEYVKNFTSKFLTTPVCSHQKIAEISENVNWCGSKFLF